MDALLTIAMTASSPCFLLRVFVWPQSEIIGWRNFSSKAGSKDEPKAMASSLMRAQALADKVVRSDSAALMMPSLTDLMPGKKLVG